MPRPNLPLVPDERSVRSRRVSGKRKERNALKHRKKMIPSRTRHRDWPRPRHICSGRPFGTLTLDFVPADVTKAFRRNMHYPH